MRLSLLCLLSLLATAPAFAAPPALVPGRILVEPAAHAKDDADADAVVGALAAATRLPLALEKRSLFGWLVVDVRGAGAVDTERAVRALAAQKGVLAVEPDVRLFALRVPNDPLYDDLWGFSAIEAEGAWDITTGLGSQRIGLVDTGIRRNHTDLAPHDVAGFDFVSDPDSGGDGDGRDDDYSDEGGRGEYHGSHVAGTMLARGDDGKGVPGLNWNAGLVTARALGVDGGGDLVDIMEGASWLAGFDVDGAPALGGHKASVINLSLGASAPCSRFEHDVMKQILDAGVSVVAAAGNDGNDVGTGSPANCPGVIAVAAADASLALAGYSNFDHRVDVVAPGGDTRQAEDEGILSVDGATRGGHKYLAGTSMASPHVAGVVSLMQAVNPALTPARIRTILKASPYTCDGCDDRAFLQADAAVSAAQAAAAPPPSSSHGTHSHSGDESDVDVSCDPARGNWDCAPGFGCVDGMCVEGVQGRTGLGEACGADDECNSGLCDAGVCTRPCDGDGCPAGDVCDAAAIPGGLCRSAPGASCASAGGDAHGLLLALAGAALVRRRRLADPRRGAFASSPL